MQEPAILQLIININSMTSHQIINPQLSIIWKVHQVTCCFTNTGTQYPKHQRGPKCLKSHWICRAEMEFFYLIILLNSSSSQDAEHLVMAKQIGTCCEYFHTNWHTADWYIYLFYHFRTNKHSPEKKLSHNHLLLTAGEKQQAGEGFSGAPALSIMAPRRVSNFKKTPTNQPTKPTPKIPPKPKPNPALVPLYSWLTPASPTTPHHSQNTEMLPRSSPPTSVGRSAWAPPLTSCHYPQVPVFSSLNWQK